MLAVVVDAPEVAGVKGELVAIDVGELGELWIGFCVLDFLSVLSGLCRSRQLIWLMAHL